MLCRLYISNFALINEMDVTFPGGLTVITGETGAGKSIFLEALGLALGKRADPGTLRNKAKKCIVEAEFDASSLNLREFFEENDLEYDSRIILRREISAEGKSRSFLNDSPASLGALKFLSEKLIDVHSQHQTLLLNQSDFQMELLDAFAGSQALYTAYRSAYHRMNKLKDRLGELQEQEVRARKELDYYKFLFEELEEARPEPGQLARLESEGLSLENAETIKASLLRAAQSVSGGDENILSSLAQVKQALQGLSKYGEQYAGFAARISSVYIELKDLGNEVEEAGNDLHFDESRLSEVNQRMDLLNRLLKKHNVNDEESLLKVKEETENKLSAFGSLESQIEAAQKELSALLSECTKRAGEISALRAKAVPGLEKEVKTMLNGLSMENAVFRVQLTPLPQPGAGGMDQLKFLFSANKGAALSELQKVASGGELSRLMLTLKSLLAGRKELPAIIFDEIDTGVSGEVADKIGTILYKMGKKMQVITITHLPQMASKGKHHLFVYKKDDEDQTVSYIRELSGAERVTEIAKMLSTGKPTESALKNARELLSI